MKNITLSVPDDVCRAAQVQAEERGVTVSTPLADYLHARIENPFVSAGPTASH